MGRGGTVGGGIGRLGSAPTGPRGWLLVLAVASLCAVSAPSPGQPARAEAVRKAPHLRVVAAPFEPFAYQSDGVNKGLDIDLLNLVCTARGWTYDIEWIPFPEVLSRIRTGKADLAIGAIYTTDDRRKEMLFTDSYLQSGLVLVTRADRTVRPPEGMAGLRIGVKRGATGEALAKHLRDVMGVPLQIVPMDSTEDCFEALQAHRLDAVMNDYLNSVFLLHNRYPGEMVISRGFFGAYFFSRSEIAFPLRLGMDSQCFAINQTLRELKRGGIIAHLQEQWLTQSPPPDMERITIILAGVLLFLLAHVAIFFYYRGRNLRLRVLAESEQHYRDIIEQSPMAIGIQRRGVILYVNDALARIFGLPGRESMSGRSIFGFIAEDQRERVMRFIEARTSGLAAPDAYGTIAVRADGTHFPAHVKVAPVTLADGPAHIIFMEDFTEQIRAGEALRESEERFRALAETTTAAIFIYQRDKFIYVNPATQKMSGYSREDLLRMHFWDLVHPDHRELVRERGLARQRGEAVEPHYEFKILCKDGTERWVVFSAGITELKGSPAGMGTAFDITERKRAEDRLEHLAHFDFLTGLPNRLLFYEHLGAAIARAGKEGGTPSVILADMDRFKDVNEALGHDLGDLVLQGIARRMAATAGTEAEVARLGSDEFAFLLHGRQGDAAPEDLARRLLADLARPFTVAGQEVQVSPSFGLCTYPADGDDIEGLMNNAAVALSRARAQGGNTFQWVTSDLSAKAAEQAALKNRLRKAIELQEFEVHYQPILDVNGNRVVAMEALIRWKHPELGMLPPVKFIKLAEETGLILPLGEWVLYAACAQNKAWQKAGYEPIRVSVNLSARQFQQRDLMDTISLVLKSTGLAPRYLTLEITESTAMVDMDNTVGLLHGLRDLGISIAIDDFGTGYSSFSYLKKFPIHELKIDHSFVQDVPMDADDAAIVKAVVTMGHGLNLRVVAEGVENAAQQEFLQAVGCDAVQGFHFQAPAPARDVERLLVR